MKTLAILTVLALLVPTHLPEPNTCCSGVEDPQEPEAKEDARFALLKSLAGTWESQESAGGHAEGVTEFRVSVGGTIVEERIFLGTPMEMLTIYHMDGEQLLATHYCMLGNAPHLKAGALGKDGSLEFRCDGKPSNVESHEDNHIHGWTMRLNDQGHLLSNVNMISKGKASAEPMQFHLVRK